MYISIQRNWNVRNKKQILINLREFENNKRDFTRDLKERETKRYTQKHLNRKLKKKKKKMRLRIKFNDGRKRLLEVKEWR